MFLFVTPAQHNTSIHPIPSHPTPDHSIFKVAEVVDIAQGEGNPDAPYEENKARKSSQTILRMHNKR